MPKNSEKIFPLDLIEMGLSDDLAATVVAIEKCPRIVPGAGRVVLTTVNSPSVSVMELSIRHVDGRTETIRPTAGHQFYSEDRQEWVRTRDLRFGEQLRGLDGSVTVQRTRPIAGTERVYNMTVESEHRYFVATSGLLAHNNGGLIPPSGPCPTPGGPPRPLTTAEIIAKARAEGAVKNPKPGLPNQPSRDMYAGERDETGHAEHGGKHAEYEPPPPPSPPTPSNGPGK
jgi:hypothetical protein